MESKIEVVSEECIIAGFKNIVISTDDDLKENRYRIRTNIFNENQFQHWKEVYSRINRTSLNVIGTASDAEHNLFRSIMEWNILYS